MINADKLAKRIAGHSNYHGDSILAAIYCAAEGKENDAPIRSIETPQNEPLTLEQLRKMDGQPVWIKQLKDLSVCDTGWALIDTCTDRIRVWWPGSEVEDEPSEEYYGKTWVAYGRPPERQEDNNETD